MSHSYSFIRSLYPRTVLIAGILTFGVVSQVDLVLNTFKPEVLTWVSPTVAPVHSVVQLMVGPTFNPTVTPTTAPTVTPVPLLIEPIKVTALPAPDVRQVRIDYILSKYKSPAAGLGNVFVQMGDKYNVDPYLVVAIGMHESAHFKKCVKGRGNCWGITNGKGGFADYPTITAGIEQSAKLLAGKYYRHNSYAPANIEGIGKTYAADPVWYKGVRRFYSEL